MPAEPIDPVLIQRFFTRSITVEAGTVQIWRDMVLDDGEEIVINDTGELFLI